MLYKFRITLLLHCLSIQLRPLSGVARPTYNLHQRLNIMDPEPTNLKVSTCTLTCWVPEVNLETKTFSLEKCVCKKIEACYSVDDLQQMLSFVCSWWNSSDGTVLVVCWSWTWKTLRLLIYASFIFIWPLQKSKVTRCVAMPSLMAAHWIGVLPPSECY